MGSFTFREKVILMLLVLLLVAGAVWKAVQTRVPAADYLEPLPEQEEPEPEIITIHLVGEVNQPGIYRLPLGSRVYEALERAGGATPEAALDQVNLARPLYDGEQLYIAGTGGGGGLLDGPSEGQLPPETVKEEKVNINMASEEELMTLPGIGPGRARRIIEHRDRYGYFTDITQLMEVSGIGEGIFGGLEKYVTIY